MRKTVIVILSILFTGALLLYTAQANLDLLTQVSPNPQFVGFAMVALEGGVLYWTGYYLLHWHGIHKGIAMVVQAWLNGSPTSSCSSELISVSTLAWGLLSILSPTIDK